MEKEKDQAEKKQTIENVLKKKGKLIYNFHGISMRPMLCQENGILVLRRKEPDERCRKNDVVLFKRDNGQYVLHRILKVREKDYWIVGDNCYSGENIREEQVLGVLTNFTRKGRSFSVENRWYKLYVWLWCDPWPLRMWIGRRIMFVKRCLRWLRKHILQADQ